MDCGGFTIDGDHYRMSQIARFNRTAGRNWMTIVDCVALSPAGSLDRAPDQRPLKQRHLPPAA
jgi:hypothetical protein